MIPAKKPCSPLEKSAFSLIELLVVLAIIGILAALIFPSIGSALRAGRSAHCKINLKQWASAWVMASQDEDGRLIMSWAEKQSGVTEKRHSWHQTIHQYMSLQNIDEVWQKAPSIYCAEAKNAANPIFYPKVSYSMMLKGTKWEKDWRYAIEKYEHISPAWVLLMDACLGSNGNCAEARVYKTSNQDEPFAAAFRHKGDKANMVFFDTSVASLTYQQLLDKDLYNCCVSGACTQKCN